MRGWSLVVALLSLAVHADPLVGPTRSWSFDTPTKPWTADGVALVPEKMARSPGYAGQAARFGGAASLRLEVGADAFSTGFTIAFLVRPDAAQTSAGPVNLISCPGRFLLRLDPVHRGRQVSLFLDRAGKLEPRASGPALPAGEWSQIIAVATPEYAYIWVNGIEYSVPRPGKPSTDSGPLIVGGALPGPVGAAAFSGCIDQLELRSGAVGRQWIFRRVLWPQGDPRPDGHVGKRIQQFPEDAKGWTGLWGAKIADTEALALTLPAPSSRLVSPLLRIPLAENDGLHLDLATRSGVVGEVFLYSEDGFQERRFQIIPDGRSHRYSVPLDRERLRGAITGLSFRMPRSTATVVNLHRIAFAPLAATAEPKLVLRAFAPERQWVKPGERLAIRALLKNEGHGGGAAQLRLTSPLPLLSPAEAAVRLPPGEEREVVWHVQAGTPGAHTVQLEVLEPDAKPFRAVAEVIVQGVPLRPPALREGYPRAMDFRHLGVGNQGIQAQQSMLLVDLIGDKIEAARAFKKRYPETCVLMQINDEPNGLWGTWFTVPREYAIKEGTRCEPDVFPMPDFKGYWLLRPGATLTTDFPAKQEQITLPVPDPKRFLHRRFGGKGVTPHDALVYRLGPNGPDWEQAEYVTISAVDVKTKEITVERWPKAAVGTWHGFAAGQAVIAPSAGDVYRHRTWIPNLSKFCPRDPASGLDACEWWARHFARLWHRRIARDAPHPDGMQFDWAPFRAHKADADCDLDGEPDGGDFAGISHWGLGMHRFFSLLRSGGKGWEGVGNQTLLAADASNVSSQRSFALLNGSENEEFCGFGHPKAFSAQFDLYRLWCREARLPRVSYLQSRFPCDIHTGGDFDRASRRDNFASAAKIRLALAAACMELGIHTYRPGGRQDIQDIDRCVTRRYDLDEYLAGRDGRFNWLGKPLGEARRAPGAMHAEAVLASDFADGVEGWTLGKTLPVVATEPVRRDLVNGNHAIRFGVSAIHGRRVPGSAAGIVSPWSTAIVGKGQEVVLTTRVWANPQFDEREGALYANIPRELAFALESEDGTRTDAARILVGEKARELRLSFVVPGDGRLRVVCEFGADLGPVWLDDLSLCRGCGDIMYRRFEHGIVLMNGSLATPFAFDTVKLDGRPLRQLDGLHSPLYNRGEPVPGEILVAPQDARFLRLR